MNKFLSIILLAAVLGVRQGTAQVHLSDFYPYGTAAGDLIVPTADDNFVEHQLSSGHHISFFGQDYDKVFVNNNGGISFIRGVPQFTPTCGPQNTPMVIPFWADVDTTQGGSVWYRESTDSAILAKATRETLEAYPGLARTLNINRVFIVTWDNVAFFGSLSCGAEANALRNNFQAIIATDGTLSFIIFNFESVNWITGRASGGECNGRGGTAAKAGFDFGDNVNFYSLPGSCTEDIDAVATTTNVNQPGRWIFRVDQEHIDDPAEEDPFASEEIVVTDDPIETEPIEIGQCDPNNCNLIGYCYQYAQCDHETRTYRTQHCSQGLYWNPNNNSAYEPVPIMSAGRRSLISKRQIELGGNAEEYPQEHAQQQEEECHGSCDIWDNLSPEIQSMYAHDEQCFPRCMYSAVAECENRYHFHPHNTDARHFETVHCPMDTRHGMNIPMVWVQERETCDFCYNAYRISEYHEENSTNTMTHVSPCCERYDNSMESAPAPGPADYQHEAPASGPADYYHEAPAPGPADYHHAEPAPGPADYYHEAPAGRSIHPKGHSFDIKRKI